MQSETYVKILAYTPEPENVVAIAMRQSRFAGGVRSLNLDQSEVKRLIELAMSLGHFSVFEHVSFTFAVEGISRSCSHQFVRHRFFSFTQQSQRYVKYKGIDYILPPSIQENSEASAIFDETVRLIEQAYKKLLELKIPAEDARFVLPNATETKMVATANARELMHFFKLRLDEHAQWEIRGLARIMFSEVSAICPNIFNEYNISRFE
ncbi:MAG: FAD-dependent thymidylate synthase [Caldisericaceae bacterium]